MAHWIIIGNFEDKVKAMRDIADVLQGHWNNYSSSEQEAIEDILDDFEAWTTTAGSYPGANAKIEQMCTELEAFLPPQD